jgi:hypothetical protein
MRAGELADFWDEVLTSFLAGALPHRDDAGLAQWYSSYRGRGAGAVSPEAMPEPYIGPLDRLGTPPRLVILGLNPGDADLGFQGRDGLFAQQIQASSYRAWAASSPYASPSWEQVKGRNMYLRSRTRFARTFFDDSNVQPSDLLLMELYPWHSARVTASMRPPAELLRRYVWDPLADLDASVVFAFGRAWIDVAENLGLAPQRLGVSFSVDHRHVRLYRLSSQQVLCVLWQRGYAGPPAVTDTLILRERLDAAGFLPD